MFRELRRQDALYVFKSRRCEHCLHRVDRAGKKLHRGPIQLMDFLERLGCEFWSREVDQRIGAGSLQLDNLRIDRGGSQFVVRFCDDPGFGIVSQCFFEAGQIVLSIVVVLVENGDFCIGHVLENVVAECGAFHLEGGIEWDSPGEILRIVEAPSPC